MAELQRVTDTLRAVMKEAGTTDPETWINPPGALSVRQLHVHVSPHFRGSREETQEVLTRVSAAMAQKLGAPTPPLRNLQPERSSRLSERSSFRDEKGPRPVSLFGTARLKGR